MFKLFFEMSHSQLTITNKLYTTNVSNGKSFSLNLLEEKLFKLFRYIFFWFEF